MVIVKDESRCSRLCLLECQSDAADYYFRNFLAGVRADVFLHILASSLTVTSRMSVGSFASYQELTTARSPEINGMVERGLGNIDKAVLAARVQTSINLSHVRLPSTELLGAGAMRCACNAQNHTSTTVNPQHKSPYAMWRGTVAPSSPRLFLRPGYHRWNSPSNSIPGAERSPYVG